MLQRHLIDDQTFAEIMEDAIARAREVFPLWSNFNPSEPALTLLELFAWLKEMQQYHIGKTHPASLEKLLRMVGGRELAATPASALVYIASSLDCELNLPSGTALNAPGVRFETTRDTVVYPHKIVVPGDGDGGLVVPAESGFTFAVCFDRMPPVGKPFSLYFELAPEDGRNPVPDDFSPGLASFRWQAEGRDGLFDVTVLRDETRGLLFSGEVTLLFESETEPVRVGEMMVYALRVTTVKCYYESPRRITGIYLNTVPVTQAQPFGAGGNVRAGAIAELDPPIDGLVPVNRKPAAGGADALTLEEAFREDAERKHIRGTAVTLADYEAAAMVTPGLALKRVKAMADGNTVVITAQQRGAGVEQGYLDAIARWLDRYRLLTTRVIVKPPYRIETALTLDAYADASDRETADRLRKAAEMFFEALDIGAPAYRSELYGTMEPLCRGIHSLELTPLSRGGTRTADGGIAPPPYGILFLKEINIRMHRKRL